MAQNPSGSEEPRPRTKSATAFRTISEVAGNLDIPQHVLRFWESKFSQVNPLKRGGGRRYYRPDDIVLLQRIKELLYNDGYTIKGVQKLLREGSLKAPVANPADRPDAVTDGRPAGKKRSQAELRAILEELSAVRDLLKELP